MNYLNPCVLYFLMFSFVAGLYVKIFTDLKF